MRLLVVTFDPPENVGGVEGRAIGYTRELVDRGYHVSVIAFGRNYAFSKEPFQRTALYRYPSKPASFLSGFRHFIGILRTDSTDSVFVLSGSTTLIGVAVLLYCRLSRRRSAAFLYGKDILTTKGKAHERILLSLSEVLTNVVVTNSRYTSSLLPSFLRSRARVLHPSVDERMLSPPPMGDHVEGRRILIVGRLVERKGVDDLLAAFKLVVEDHPDARLEIVGDGPERKRLESLVVDLNLGQMVTFYGELRGDALNERYLQCEVFAMPSKTLRGDVEGFGTVFLEAGMFGKPSVGTTSGGIPEAVLDGRTGIIVKEGDVQGLSKALRLLLDDETLARKLGEEARRRVLDEFTWAKGTERLLQILTGKEAQE